MPVDCEGCTPNSKRYSYSYITGSRPVAGSTSTKDKEIQEMNNLCTSGITKDDIRKVGEEFSVRGKFPFSKREISSRHMIRTEQTKTPQSKKKRIRAKWAKKYTRRTVLEGFYVVGDMVIAHPLMWCAGDKMKANLQANQEARMFQAMSEDLQFYPTNKGE